jgi:RNA polymerase sigma factor (sigma-70 family)
MLIRRVINPTLLKWIKLTEQEAIDACLGGHMEAFSHLYDSYIEKVYRFVYYRVGHKQEAEDLVSVIFTKAYSKFQSFDRKSKFGPWIISIARNTVIDFYRTRKFTSDIEDAFDISSNTNLSKEFEMKEKLDEVMKYLNTLSSDQKDLVVMRLWDGLSYEEISQVLGKSEASLRVSFSRIVSKMQKELIFAILFFAIIK